MTKRKLYPQGYRPKTGEFMLCYKCGFYWELKRQLLDEHRLPSICPRCKHPDWNKPSVRAFDEKERLYGIPISKRTLRYERDVKAALDSIGLPHNIISHVCPKCAALGIGNEETQKIDWHKFSKLIQKISPYAARVLKLNVPKSHEAAGLGLVATDAYILKLVGRLDAELTEEEYLTLVDCVWTEADKRRAKRRDMMRAIRSREGYLLSTGQAKAIHET